MSIGIKETGEFIWTPSAVGTQTTGKKASFVVPFTNGCVLKSVIARVGTAGVTGTQNVDLQKNGTSVFASGAAAIQFATTAVVPTYGAVAAANPPVFAKGDILTVNVTTIHSGTAAVDLALFLIFQRQRGTNLTAALQTDI